MNCEVYFSNIMNITLELATIEQKDIVGNLMEKYIYELSQYFVFSITESGQYGCADWIETYWQDKNRWPYIICVDKKLAGFTLVRDSKLKVTKLTLLLMNFSLFTNIVNMVSDNL